jgi:hypothetical protein
MNSMFDAIRAKRQGGLIKEDAPEMPAKQPEGEGAGLKDLVTALSDEQKQELLALLSQDMSGTAPEKIQQGDPSSEEKAEIEAQIAQEEEPDEKTESGGMEDEFLKQNPASSAGNSLGDKVRNMILEKRKQKGKM